MIHVKNIPRVCEENSTVGYDVRNSCSKLSYLEPEVMVCKGAGSCQPKKQVETPGGLLLDLPLESQPGRMSAVEIAFTACSQETKADCLGTTP